MFKLRPPRLSQRAGRHAPHGPHGQGGHRVHPARKNKTEHEALRPKLQETPPCSSALKVVVTHWFFKDSADFLKYVHKYRCSEWHKPQKQSRLQKSKLVLQLVCPLQSLEGHIRIAKFWLHKSKPYSHKIHVKWKSVCQTSR